jgi:hypothetical protein
MNNLVPVSDLERMAAAVAQSGLFGVKTPAQAMALMLVAQAEGMHPATAARDFHIVDGRPALKADAMLARFQAAGGRVRWTEYTAERVAAVFSHAAGGEVELDWTIAQARAAGLATRKPWQQYPRAMLRARVISEGIRTCFPGVAVGTYTVEELQDMSGAPSSSRSPTVPTPTDGARPLEAFDELDRLATDAAAGGLAAYQAFFSALGTEQKRALIACGAHADNKSAAAAVDLRAGATDARIVDEAVE